MAFELGCKEQKGFCGVTGWGSHDWKGSGSTYALQTVSESKNRGKASSITVGMVDVFVFIILDEVQSKGL